MMKMEILSCSMISLSCAYWSLRSFSGIIEEVKRLNTQKGGKPLLWRVRKETTENHIRMALLMLFYYWKEVLRL